jgi:hypothetical protein
LTQAGGAGGGLRNICLATQSMLAAIKEGDLGHSEKGDCATVLVCSFDWLII